MLNRKYKVRLAFNNATNDVIIGAKELPSVLWAFAKNTKVILDSGAFRGQDIISVLPDKVASMGWNDGYIPQAYDQEDIQKELGRSLETYQSEIKGLLYKANSLEELNQLSFPLLEKLEQKLLN